MRLVGSQYIRIARRSGASLGGRVSMAAFALFFRSCILFLADYFLVIDKRMEASAPPSENLSDTICPRCTVTIWRSSANLLQRPFSDSERHASAS